MIPLEEKEKGLRENIDQTAAKVDKAIAHANNLSNYAETLEKYVLLFKSNQADLSMFFYLKAIELI